MEKELRKVTKETAVLELLQRGYSAHDIAAELKMSTRSVLSIVENWVGYYSRRAEDNASELIMTKLMQLDYLYQTLLPYALPRVDEASGTQLPPDPKMLDQIKKIIAEYREWVRLRLAFTQRSSQDESVVIEPTLSTDSYLYESAFNELESGEL